MKKHNQIHAYRRISKNDYEKILKSQNGKCSICGKTETENKRRLCVDHNHETQEVRGLLCRSCNLGIGYMKESIPIMESAVVYIKRSGTGVFLLSESAEDHYMRRRRSNRKEDIVKRLMKEFGISRSTVYNRKKSGVYKF